MNPSLAAHLYLDWEERGWKGNMRIAKRWVKIIAFAGVVVTYFDFVSAHPGRTNAEGCHAGKQPYHCHDGSGAATSQGDRKKKAAQPAGSEDAYNAAFCSAFGGHTETRHTYQYPGGSSYVKVDCETDTTVYEGGLDKRSNLDSVQQALFFASLTGKEPAVVIYNTDGRIGKYEHRM